MSRSERYSASLSGDGSWREGKTWGGEFVVRTMLAVIEVQDLAG